jgi:hypothetical protein
MNTSQNEYLPFGECGNVKEDIKQMSWPHIPVIEHDKFSFLMNNGRVAINHFIHNKGCHCLHVDLITFTLVTPNAPA